MHAAGARLVHCSGGCARRGLSTQRLRAAAMAEGSRSATGIAAPEQQQEVFVKQSPNGVLSIALNRPKALNAAHVGMVEAILKAVEAAHAPGHGSAGRQQQGQGPKAIVVEGSARAFCSGGDVKALREAVLKQPYEQAPPDGHLSQQVFQAEYSLVCTIARCPLPYISLCSGVWMGFGVGLAGFGFARVVTDSTLWAMPENAIGLWPDVGFATLAARMPSQALGLYLGLTGARVSSPADLLYLGLATHYVPADKWEALRARLLPESGNSSCASGDAVDVQAVLAEFATTPSQASGLQKLQGLVDRLFKPALEYRSQGHSLAQALQAIVDRATQELARVTAAQEAAQQQQAQSMGAPQAGAPAAADGITEEPSSKRAKMEGGEAAAAAQLQQERQLLEGVLKAMSSLSPFSLALTLAHFARVAEDVREGGPLSALDRNMQLEYAIAVRSVARPDFAEGVRAVLVDKDQRPAWSPAGLADVRDEQVLAMLQPLPGGAGLQLAWQAN